MMNNIIDNKKYKIIIIIMAFILAAVSLITINLKKDKVDNKINSDAIKFKEEYEKLNGKTAYEDYKYPSIKILENNHFKYKSYREIIKIIKNGTGIIYFGFNNCPWCRNAVSVLQYVNSDIYYIDVTDLRDSYDYINNKLIKTKVAPDEYYEILNLLDGILDEYEIEDNDGNKIDVGEKRLYVPLVVGIKEGKIIDYHLDTVTLNDNQTPYDLLDNNQKEKLKEIYDRIKSKVYEDDTCGLKPDEGC